MSKAYFCYEFLHDTTPSPVIYYGEIPSRYSKESNPRREKIVDVSHIPKGADNELSISELVKIYPYLTKETSTITVKSQETRNMSQPVTGYLTKNNMFFPTKAKADFYDANYDLFVAATDAVKGLGISDENHVAALVKGFQEFLEEEVDLISEFIAAKRAVTEEEKRENEVVGSAAGDNSTANLSVQPIEQIQGMVEETAPERVAPAIGKKSKL